MIIKNMWNNFVLDNKGCIVLFEDIGNSGTLLSKLCVLHCTELVFWEKIFCATRTKFITSAEKN